VARKISVEITATRVRSCAPSSIRPAFKGGLGYDSGSTRGIGFGEMSALLTEM
jgi:hypothetical protein